MAKDDFFVVAYKILLYYYACLKRARVFDKDEFDRMIGAKDINEDYLLDIFMMLYDNGYLDGVNYKRAFGGDLAFINPPDKYKITLKGIEYLQENSMMSKTRDMLLKTASPIASLIKLVFPL